VYKKLKERGEVMKNLSTLYVLLFASMLICIDIESRRPALSSEPLKTTSGTLTKPTESTTSTSSSSTRPGKFRIRRFGPHIPKLLGRYHRTGVISNKKGKSKNVTVTGEISPVTGENAGLVCTGNICRKATVGLKFRRGTTRGRFGTLAKTTSAD